MNKKGFSLVEVVVSISLILIVTITSITIITKASINNTINEEKVEEMAIINNMTELFKGCSDVSTFNELVANSIDSGNYKLTVLGEEYHYTLSKNNVVTELVVNYQKVRPTLTCVAKVNEKEFMRFSYEK